MQAYKWIILGILQMCILKRDLNAQYFSFLRKFAKTQVLLMIFLFEGRK